VEFGEMLIISMVFVAVLLVLEAMTRTTGMLGVIANGVRFPIYLEGREFQTPKFPLATGIGLSIHTKLTRCRRRENHWPGLSAPGFERSCHHG